MKECAIYKSTQIIGKKWTTEILLELYKDEEKIKHFNELKRRLGGITPTALSTRLSELEGEGLIEKRIDASILPAKSNYSLTECGEDFMNVIWELKSWSTKWKYRNKGCEKAQCMYCKV
jgi:DNA-binding HxlR family transcriptional regulator